jgi:glycosyltransferase involved in cell wall biosynthesis
MPLAPKADVIVPLDRDPVLGLRCLTAVLDRSGPPLNHLIVVDDQGAESEIATELERLAARDGRVRVVSNYHPLGEIGSWNHGLSLRDGDAVLLAADCVVEEDWLTELADVAHSEERTACVSPLTNVGGLCSVPELNRYCECDDLDARAVRAACAGLPRWTVAPSLNGSCMYLRGGVIDAVGLLATSATSTWESFDDWVTRARALGFLAKRANRVFVRGSRPAPIAVPVDPDQAAPEGDPILYHVEQFCRTLDGHLAAHAVAWSSSVKLRLGYDIRYLPTDQVGTRTYAVALAQALALLPEVDLTLIVRDPAQAIGMSGRIVTEEGWGDDVAVIHRPAQVFSPCEIKLLFGSSAHVVITYQDLIGYRIPQVFPTDAEFDGYRATSNLTLPAAQKVVAYSENTANEIVAAFGIPRQEIIAVPLGVEASWFALREESDVAIRASLDVPRRYFLSLATDYPHKNLANLLDAYAMLRRRWRGDEPPSLVLAGYMTTSRMSLYGRMATDPLGDGLRFLGPVTRDQLRVLYQDALALVFPSVYEGFGLPPLEAMAAGTPVIAMPISSVPEVAGDAALYAGGLASKDLARAMESIACDEDLRAEHRDRGLRRVQQFRWENTARATVDVYKSAILQSSERSLQMRRNLQNSLACWGEPVFQLAPPSVPEPEPDPVPESMGILNAWRALNFALYTRLRRELERFHPASRRESA